MITRQTFVVSVPFVANRGKKIAGGAAPGLLLH
jgi:hypothetical protein